jgi:hypothetical protein
MRSLADGKIRWGFFPPSNTVDRAGRGIWLGGKADDALEDSDDAISVGEDELRDATGVRKVRFEGEDTDEESTKSDEEAEDTDSDEEGESGKDAGGGFFAALQLEDQSSEEEEDEEDEDESESSEDDHEAHKEDRIA